MNHFLVKLLRVEVIKWIFTWMPHRFKKNCKRI